MLQMFWEDPQEGSVFWELQRLLFMCCCLWELGASALPHAAAPVAFSVAPSQVPSGVCRERAWQSLVPAFGPLPRMITESPPCLGPVGMSTGLSDGKLESTFTSRVPLLPPPVRQWVGLSSCSCVGPGARVHVLAQPWAGGVPHVQ